MLAGQQQTASGKPKPAPIINKASPLKTQAKFYCPQSTPALEDSKQLTHSD